MFWRAIGVLAVLAVLGGGGGLVLGKIILANLKGDQSSITLGLAIVLVVLGYLMSLGINCIHKYYLMKQYRPELFHR